MLSFKDEDTIKVYKVALEKPDKAQEILKEVIGTEQRQRKEEGHQSIFTNYDRGFQRFNVELTDEGLETISYSPYHSASYSDYTLGDVVTTTISYSAPYTLALAAENLSFGPYEFSSLLKKSERSNNLVSVINGANIDELEKLLACFNNNPEALEIFLKTHYPDLLYLRRYLECIRLDLVEKHSEEELMTKAYSKRVIERAATNAEIAKKIGLTFKGRSR